MIIYWSSHSLECDILRNHYCDVLLSIWQANELAKLRNYLRLWNEGSDETRNLDQARDLETNRYLNQFEYFYAKGRL